MPTTDIQTPLVKKPEEFCDMKKRCATGGVMCILGGVFLTVGVVFNKWALMPGLAFILGGGAVPASDCSYVNNVMARRNAGADKAIEI